MITQVRAKGEDVVVTQGVSGFDKIVELTLNPRDARQLATGLLDAADRAVAYGAAGDLEDAARAMGGGGKVVDAEMPAPKPGPVLCLFYAGPVLVDVGLIDIPGARVERHLFGDRTQVWAVVDGQLVPNGLAAGLEIRVFKLEGIR